MGQAVDEIKGKKILVVDDDHGMLKLVSHTFSRLGSKVYIAPDGPEALRLFYAEQPDLVILDIMMPEMDGWEVCRQIRRLSDVPIIMLTALGHDDDMLRGFTYGADDYIVKPFNPKILAVRAQATLRRTVVSNGTGKPATYRDGYLTIDLNRHRVLVRDKLVKLSATEYKLLACLLENAGRVLTFNEILKTVWGEECRDNPDYVHVYVWHLRKKLEENPKNPKYILTEHGIGYRFEKAHL